MPEPLDNKLPDAWLTPDRWALARRGDGAVLVRVASWLKEGSRLPDAVFAFREGDPQFSFWNEKLRSSEHSPA